ncbi:hypothetical protein M0812_12971 [Anaeramoeba flamelloides]|uniref:Uncharacterized protein n=1 Tax=Anaeramoeba flamelloides TaxID=1746091 RepID=A0AAV7ZL02_9EUKA|nr:hypothetical protein M0812_12971 [Anaeramoeba flamelloides]
MKKENENEMKKENQDPKKKMGFESFFNFEKSDSTLAPLIGSKYSLVNSKNRDILSILEKRNNKLFFSKEFNKIEWEYFSDYAPKQYYLDGNVCYSLFVVVERKLPLESGQLLISKKKLKISSESTNTIIPFAENLSIENMHLPKLIKIQSQGKKKKQNKTSILLAASKEEKIILMKTIQYFYKKWKKNKMKKK